MAAVSDVRCVSSCGRPTRRSRSIEPGYVRIRVKWGPASARLVAHVDSDGELEMDSSGVPSFLGLRGPIDDWVANLNAHLRATGRRLEPAEAQGDKLILRTRPR